jgi:hypothetical protein
MKSKALQGYKHYESQKETDNGVQTGFCGKARLYFGLLEWPALPAHFGIYVCASVALSSARSPERPPSRLCNPKPPHHDRAWLIRSN